LLLAEWKKSKISNGLTYSGRVFSPIVAEMHLKQELAFRCFLANKRWQVLLENNFDFCICFLSNLCYGVYIPVKEAVELAAPDLEVSCVTGLPARTARPFVPPFFFAPLVPAALFTPLRPFLLASGESWFGLQ
jgi:hypothetical protein